MGRCIRPWYKVRAYIYRRRPLVLGIHERYARRNMLSFFTGVITVRGTFKRRGGTSLSRSDQSTSHAVHHQCFSCRHPVYTECPTSAVCDTRCIGTRNAARAADCVLRDHSQTLPAPVQQQQRWNLLISTSQHPVQADHRSAPELGHTTNCRRAVRRLPSRELAASPHRSRRAAPL